MRAPAHPHSARNHDDANCWKLRPRRAYPTAAERVPPLPCVGSRGGLPPREPVCMEVVGPADRRLHRPDVDAAFSVGVVMVACWVGMGRARTTLSPARSAPLGPHHGHRRPRPIERARPARRADQPRPLWRSVARRGPVSARSKHHHRQCADRDEPAQSRDPHAVTPRLRPYGSQPVKANERRRRLDRHERACAAVRESAGKATTRPPHRLPRLPSNRFIFWSPADRRPGSRTS